MREIAKVWEGGRFTPPLHPIGLNDCWSWHPSVKPGSSYRSIEMFFTFTSPTDVGKCRNPGKPHPKLVIISRSCSLWRTFPRFALTPKTLSRCAIRNISTYIYQYNSLPLCFIPKLLLLECEYQVSGRLAPSWRSLGLSDCFLTHFGAFSMNIAQWNSL